MEVDGISVAKALAIENASVISGYIAPGTGHLILVTKGGTEIDAGDVVPDPPDLSSMVVSGTINSSGRLILTRQGGGAIDAGLVRIRTVVNFTASGNFVKGNYPGMTRALFEFWGAGGGGSVAGSEVGGGGGGGGAYHRIEIPAAKLPTTLALVVGAGGPANNTIGAIGTAGGDSYFNQQVNVGSNVPVFKYGAGGGGTACTDSNTFNEGYSGGGGGVSLLGEASTGGNAGPSSGGSGGSSSGGIGGGSQGGSAATGAGERMSGGGGADGGDSNGGIAYNGGGGGGAGEGAKAACSLNGGGGGALGSQLPGVAYAGGYSETAGRGGGSGYNTAGNAGEIPGGGGSGGGRGGTNNGGAGARGEIRVTVYFD